MKALPVQSARLRMDLTAGARLGPYEIVSPLGAGGMGQVYKARDRRLDRTVAIKILPQSLAIDAEFRQRFDREARVIAQLDHPHIGALYDVGEERGTSYLVMQFLEGETLADRLHRGPLPIEEAIRYAIQVASALAVAHRAGIVHRDLKPGNVMLTSSGAKLLDFGLAKTTSPVESTIATQATVPPQLTTQGAIMGTFQYMAPEQIEGGNADSRSDVWGYGCVLYEMLTGTQPFQGKSSASLLANILNTEPPRLRERRPSVANALDYLVHRCLQKEPEARWQSMIDITHQLHWVAAIEEGQPARVTRPLWRHPAALVAVYILAIAAVVAVNALRKPLADPASPLHLTLLPPADLTLTPFASTGAPHFALSPDGERIAFVASAVGQPPTLWVRRLDSRAAQEIPRSHDAFAPFWFPDGESLGFFAEARLKTIRLDGERPSVRGQLLDAAGGTSNGDVVLVGQAGGPILKIPVAGGALVPATAIDGESGGHRWPQFLPMVADSSTPKAAAP
jgi:eukaryotic-like serine/threonine-protein kinase